MKLREIPTNTKISDVKVRLPHAVRDFANSFSTKVNEEVWLVGPLMGDWFVKNVREDTEVLPLFAESIPWEEIGEWEVVEIFETKTKTI